MVRTQIQLTPEQARSLRAAALARGVSMAELIRESVELLLSGSPRPDRAELKRRALAAAGRFRSGTRDLGRAHDRHLARALAE